jgi:spore coat polysaccharide biosynthesis protein SpsF
MSSKRLPGKVLKDISGQTMLERVVGRTRLCQGIDDLVIAVSTDPVDDVLVAEAHRLNAPVFRGSNEDVLDRFTRAAKSRAADVCVRITSDCPLIDPGVSGEMVRRFFEASPRVDYASNKIPQSYPRGLDTEVFSFEALALTNEQAKRDYQRSHVTIYIYEHPEMFRLLSVTSDVDRADWRWTVDTLEDLEFVRCVYDRLGATGDFAWLDVVDLLSREPSLRELNQKVVQKPVIEG